MTEILELNWLPNERFQGSWDALWLGIRMLFGFDIQYRMPPGPGPKS